MRLFISVVLAAVCSIAEPYGVNVVAAKETPAAAFRAGFCKRDITPEAAVPMWGYAARGAALSQGALDPLYAKALVIQAGDARLAIVGMDLGRGPTAAMMDKIRRELAAKADIRHVLISGSHTHHGPVIELTDEPGFGRDQFDAAVAYAQRLPDRLIDAVLEANRNLQPVRIGIATREVPLNRNRHSKRTVKPTDPMLGVLRFDDASGKPLVVLVNFAAHPVLTDDTILKFSADYPGFLQNRVERLLSTNCLFMPGAAGDLSPQPPPGVKGPQAYGEALADHAITLARSIETKVPDRPSIAGRVNHFRFRSRLDLDNPLIAGMLERAFFPELVHHYMREYQHGVQPELNSVVLNGEIAIVGGSGEFFCNHANRLRERCSLPYTFFFGYCNGYHNYFPTVEAAAEGGYGADPLLAPAELGAGEQMMNQALVNIYTMVGKFPAEAQISGASDGPN